MIEVITVLIVTLIAVVGMVNFKDYINRSEALSAMRQLSKLVSQYQKQHGRVPSESLVLEKVGELKGGVRLGDLRYRGLWIDFEAEPNDILAYNKKLYPSSLLDDGYVVLQFDGTVSWMGTEEFEELLAKQQTDVELDMIKN
ncbi:MAG: hypothetical protein JW720_15765 [Sedimentisphaerales bacterium]|nr:hypothetical protein [Sedimentisphaerales bacterium]